MNPILERLGNIGLIPVIKIDDAAKAVNLAKALISGGLPCAEITFRTNEAAESIRAITQAFPDMITGAGTVINIQLAEEAIKAGAKFIVSPGYNPAVVDYCHSKGIPIIPGINNPGGIEIGLEKGLEIFKFFPAEASGGISMLDALCGPFAQVMFMPTGGITIKNISEYIKRANVLAVGGSWMVQPTLIENENWDTITVLCREAVSTIHGFSLAHIGINSLNEIEAKKIANIFSVFNFIPREGNLSIFSSSSIEITKSPMKGSMGHIGIQCWSIERAIEYLLPFGFCGVKETAKYENGKCSMIYLNKEAGGFALHLIRAK